MSRPADIPLSEPIYNHNEAPQLVWCFRQWLVWLWLYFCLWLLLRADSFEILHECDSNSLQTAWHENSNDWHGGASRRYFGSHVALIRLHGPSFHRSAFFSGQSHGAANIFCRLKGNYLALLSFENSLALMVGIHRPSAFDSFDATSACFCLPHSSVLFLDCLSEVQVRFVMLYKLNEAILSSFRRGCEAFTCFFRGMWLFICKDYAVNV